MRKIILEKRTDYWAAWFYGVARMPEDVELPLPYHSSAPLSVIAEHMRKRFAFNYLFYRNSLGDLSHVET
jgi:hypothetical protein